MVVAIDALSPGPTSDTLLDLYVGLNYYNPYGHRTRRKGEGWEEHFVKEPRVPATLIFHSPKTRRQTLSLCSIVTHIYQGPPAPGRPLEEYTHLPQEHQDLLPLDTEENRTFWLQEALTELTTQLAEGETHRPPTGQVLIEGEMLLPYGHATGEGNLIPLPERMAAVEACTWLLDTMGLETSLIWRDPNQRWTGTHAGADGLPFPGEGEASGPNTPEPHSARGPE